MPAVLIDPALPGADLIQRGLAQLGAGERTTESLLVLIGAPRLRALGINVPSTVLCTAEAPEMALYQLLALEDTDAAHSRYNALVRTLVSFERAAESAAH